MGELRVIEPDSTRSNKIAIKSSNHAIRSGFAWLVLLYAVNRDESQISPMTPKPGTTPKEIEIGYAHLERISELLVSHHIQNSSIDEIRALAERCPLTTIQLEALKVSYELFFPLADITFEDRNRVASFERTAKDRYPKTITFSSSLDLLWILIQSDPPTYFAILREWLGTGYSGASFCSDRKALIKLQYYALSLSAGTLFRLEHNGQVDTIFNTLGLYKTLLERNGTECVSIASDKENKGPLRLLKPAIRDEMLPFIRLEGNAEVCLDCSTEERTQLSSFIERETTRRAQACVEEFTDPWRGLNTFRGDIQPQLSYAPRNVILFGVPGSGKSYEIQNNYLVDGDRDYRTVFHPDYLYTDFVGQILPTVDNGAVTYEFQPGPFAYALRDAIKFPAIKHVLIIEEINRGNAAAIFGDIFQLLDRNDDGASMYSITNRELGRFIYDDPEHKISLPSNLYLIATMNTADQNVFTLDTAFQRRWRMRMILNDVDSVSFATDRILDTHVTWSSFVTNLNKAIAQSSEGVSSSEDKRIGAYFVTAEEIKYKDGSSSRSFAEKMIKYLWDDAFKYRREAVFAPYLSSLEDVIMKFVSSSGDDRWRGIFHESLVAQLLSDSSDPDEPEADVDTEIVGRDAHDEPLA